MQLAAVKNDDAELTSFQAFHHLLTIFNIIWQEFLSSYLVSNVSSNKLLLVLEKNADTGPSPVTD
jgi:hypothetical protein